jgi:hypothetical protein
MIPVPSFANPFASLKDDVVRFHLEAESGAKPAKFEFQYNPSSFSLDRSVSWDDAKTLKEPYGVLHFTGGSSDTLSFTTLFDCSEIKDETILATIEELYQLTLVQIKCSDSTKRPPIVTLLWNELSFVGVITSMKVDFTMFNEKGDPVRANVDVAMSGRCFTTDNTKDKFFAPAGA